MTEAEFMKIKKKIQANPGRDWKGFLNEEADFLTYFERLKGYEFRLVDKATDLIIDEGFFAPPVAMFHAMIKRVQDSEAAKEGREQVKPQPRSSEDVIREGRWTRFFCWLAEKRKYPKTDDEVLEMKKEFEQKYPDWQPPRRRTKGRKKPETIGDVLKSTLKELPKEV